LEFFDNAVYVAGIYLAQFALPKGKDIIDAAIVQGKEMAERSGAPSGRYLVINKNQAGICREPVYDLGDDVKLGRLPQFANGAFERVPRFAFRGGPALDDLPRVVGAKLFRDDPRKDVGPRRARGYQVGDRPRAILEVLEPLGVEKLPDDDLTLLKRKIARP
jgi:hypothetical protein